jgi:hypothetical protein
VSPSERTHWPSPDSPIETPHRTAAILRSARALLTVAIQRTENDQDLTLGELEHYIEESLALRLEQALFVARGQGDSRLREPQTRHDRAAIPRLLAGRAVRHPRWTAHEPEALS